MTDSARAALDALITFGEAGAGYEAWRTSIPWKDKPKMPDSTFRTARNRLITLGFIRHEGDRYYSHSEPEADTEWWHEDPPF